MILAMGLDFFDIWPEPKISKQKKTRVLVRGTLHRCAKDGAWSNRFSPPSCRARAGTRGNAKLVPPEYVVLFSGISRGNV